MQHSSFCIVEGTPPVEDFRRLREAVGWANPLIEATRAALEHSYYSVYAAASSEVVASARARGDGHLYLYLQDVIVDPRYRHRGIGGALTSKVLAYIASTAPDGAFVGLMAASDKAAFYERFGFVRRPDDRPGMSLLNARVP